MGDHAQQEYIQQVVDTAIRPIYQRKPKHLSNTLCQLESKRQSQLISKWLDYEKTRTPFTVIAIEETQTINFNGLDITIRIDRVDQLQDGSYLIIDYKMGKANINTWQGTRPKEPQLPLYALGYNKPIKGISFAQINVNEQCLKGLGDIELTQGISTLEKNRIDLPLTWSAALAHWQTTLANLVNEFQQGDCRIEYLDDTNKCYAGDYLRLNRFYEAQAMELVLIKNLGRVL